MLKEKAMVWPAIIGGAAILGGALLGSRDNRENRLMQQTQNDQNIQLQREFAQQGVRWKVEDAKKAGLHPLAALGAQTQSFQSQHIGGSQSPFPAAGQNISRAVRAAQTKEEKALAIIQIDMARAQLKNMKLQNVGMANSIGQLNTPSIPSKEGPVTGQDIGYEYINPQIPYSQTTGLEAGTGPGMGRSTMSSGKVIEHVSQRTQEAFENDLYAKTQYLLDRIGGHTMALKHYMLPSTKAAGLHRGKLRGIRPKSNVKGSEYRYHPIKNLWVLKKIGKYGSRLYAVGQFRKGEKVYGKTIRSKEWNKPRLKPSH